MPDANPLGTRRDQGIDRDGPAWIRARIIRMAWRWLRHRPDSARWRFSETGLVPTGARLV